MAHSHSHGTPDNTYYIDQVFTILLSAGLGLVAILMYSSGVLARILAPMFFVPVLVGGIAIVGLVVVRGIALWQEVGRAQASHDEECDHQHGPGPVQSEGEGHGHSHGSEYVHHEHTHSHAHSHGNHDHGHEHAWSPWKYIVLSVPVILYFLGMPREGFSARDIARTTTRGAVASPKRDALAMLVGGTAYTKVLRKPDPRTFTLRFKELTEAAAIPSRHEIYEGDYGILRGQYIPLPSGLPEFTLLRADMTCCTADQILLEIRIIAPEPIQGIQPEQWVRVKGLISFQRNAKGKWIPVLTLDSNADIDTNVEPTRDVNEP